MMATNPPQAIKRSLDGFGRIVIPAEFREDNVDTYIVEQGSDGVLHLHPDEE